MEALARRSWIVCGRFTLICTRKPLGDALTEGLGILRSRDGSAWSPGGLLPWARPISLSRFHYHQHGRKMLLGILYRLKITNTLLNQIRRAPHDSLV